MSESIGLLSHSSASEAGKWLRSETVLEEKLHPCPGILLTCVMKIKVISWCMHIILYRTAPTKFISCLPYFFLKVSRCYSQCFADHFCLSPVYIFKPKRIEFWVAIEQQCRWFCLVVLSPWYRPSMQSFPSWWKNTRSREEQSRPCTRRCWETPPVAVSTRNTRPKLHGWDNPLVCSVFILLSYHILSGPEALFFEYIYVIE